MPRTKLGPMFAGAVSAGALVLGGCASPAAQGPAASRTVAKVPLADNMSAGAPTAGGTVHVIGYSKNSDGPNFTVIVTGAIGDYGPAVTVHPDGTEHSSQLRLDLKHGSFRLSIAKLDKRLMRADSKWRSNPTCSFHVGVTAATPVVAGSGTGWYRGISGSLDMSITIDEVDVKPCPGGTSPFISQLIFLAGSGRVSFG
jgi:hypothetical protein